jgi:hypothetical protein
MWQSLAQQVGRDIRQKPVPDPEVWPLISPGFLHLLEAQKRRSNELRLIGGAAFKNAPAGLDRLEALANRPIEIGSNDFPLE